MRQPAKGDVLAVRAIGGLYVVTVAWDFLAGHEDKRDGLLGFAIERSELKQGEVMMMGEPYVTVETYLRSVGALDADHPVGGVMDAAAMAAPEPSLV